MMRPVDQNEIDTLVECLACNHRPSARHTCGWCGGLSMVTVELRALQRLQFSVDAPVVKETIDAIKAYR